MKNSVQSREAESTSVCLRARLDWRCVFCRNTPSHHHCAVGGTFQFFHWLMYENTAWMQAHASTKWNGLMPRREQHIRDRRYTLLSLTINSAIECAMLRAWATGVIASDRDVSTAPFWNLACLVISPFWREAHFFVYHTLLHVQPLYKWFHAHHHKSWNPGPWSGLSMHPVESLTYFSGPILLAMWCGSPFVWLYANVHAQVASVYGHHGYEPYGGSYFHYIHHRVNDCNYGTPFLPLDILTGTWNTGARDAERELKKTKKEQKNRN